MRDTSQLHDVIALEEQESASERASASTLVQRIKIALLTSESVMVAELRAMCEPCTDIRFGLALHKAREQIRDEHRIEFVKGKSGQLVTATDSQKLNKGISFARAASKKRKRAGRILGAVDTAKLTSDEQQRLTLAADHQRQMSAWEEALRRRKT